MEYFVIIALTLLFILLLSACIIFKSGSKNADHKHMTDGENRTYNTTLEIFSAYYQKCISIFRHSPIAQNAKFETLAPLHIVFDFATSELPEERRLEIMDAVYESVFDAYSDLDSKAFSQRLNMYEDILLRKDIRNLWAFGKNVLPDNIISNSAAICGDILCNPKCAVDYYNAPILLHDAFILSGFAKDMQVFNNTLLLLFKRIMEEIILPLE